MIASRRSRIAINRRAQRGAKMTIAALLSAAAAEGRRPMREVLGGFDPHVLEVDPEVLFNINTPEDLARAAALLERRRAASRM